MSELLSENEWTFYKNDNFREVIHLSDKALKIRENMEHEVNAAWCKMFRMREIKQRYVPRRNRGTIYLR